MTVLRRRWRWRRRNSFLEYFLRNILCLISKLIPQFINLHPKAPYFIVLARQGLNGACSKLLSVNVAHLCSALLSPTGLEIIIHPGVDRLHGTLKVEDVFTFLLKTRIQFLVLKRPCSNMLRNRLRTRIQPWSLSRRSRP